MVKKKTVREVNAELRRSRRPESIVSTYGYDPQRSEGSLIPPIFLSSTFVFPSAEEGERSFRIAYHLTRSRKPAIPSLIYTRLNNPNLEIVEDRLTLFETGTEAAAVFSSGMAAISTTILALVRAGESILYSSPVYGGTDYLFEHLLPRMGIHTLAFAAGTGGDAIRGLLEREAKAGHPPALVFIETPANPTCTLTDIGEARSAVDAFSRRNPKPVYLAIDNTFLGPMWQHPAELGAHLVLYSATKFIGGHSDVVAGAVLGSRALVEDQVKVARTIFGTVPSPFDAYLLMRSLDTLKMRMTAQLKNARHVAQWLLRQPQVAEVRYPGLLKDGDPQKAIYDRQCLEPGSMISFYVKGAKKEAFRVLNSLKLIKLAVSLGSTKTLAEHPATMTHSDLDPKERRRLGIDDRMIRLSIGTEHYQDIIADLREAFAQG